MSFPNRGEKTLIIVVAVFLIIILAASAAGCRTDGPVQEHGTTVDIDVDRSKPRTHKPAPRKAPPAAPRKVKR